MDLRWGYDYNHNSHTPYQHLEFTSPVDYRISTLGIDIETPVEWTCEDLQEIMNEDSNSFDSLVKTNFERDCKEESLAFQHILSDLLRTESDLETSKSRQAAEYTEESVNMATRPNIEGWLYHNQLQHNQTNDFCPPLVEQPLSLKHEMAPMPDVSPVPIGSPAASLANEHLYTLVSYNLQTEPPPPTQPAILRKSKVKAECPPPNKVPVPSSSCSPPGEENRRGKKSSKVVVIEPSISPKPDVKPVVENSTPPKRKCQDSPESSTEPAAPAPKAPKLLDPDAPSEAQPVPRASPVQKPDTTWHLGPYCTAAGFVSSDFEQTCLPDGREKLPPEALKNGMIVELNAYMRHVKATRRSLVRFLTLYFDLKYLDEANPTMVDRLFRRVIAPLLARRNELAKHNRTSVTRHGSSQPRAKSPRSEDELIEFDSAVFAIPEFVTDPFSRRGVCVTRSAGQSANERRTPVKRPPKPTQGQQLVELQARFDAFRRVQRKHNLAFLRQLSRLHAKLDALTHRLSKRIGRKSISKVPSKPLKALASSHQSPTFFLSLSRQINAKRCGLLILVLSRRQVSNRNFKTNSF